MTIATFVHPTNDAPNHLLWTLPIPKGSTVHGIVIGHNATATKLSGMTSAWENAFPNEAAVYRTACQSGDVKPGDVVRIPCVTDKRVVFLVCAMKASGESGFTYDLLTQAMSEICFHAQVWHLTSIAFPKLGCGRHSELNLRHELVVKALAAMSGFLVKAGVMTQLIISSYDVAFARQHYPQLMMLSAESLIERAKREGGVRFICTEMVKTREESIALEAVLA